MSDLVQRSAEWFAARCGHVTASRVADVIARTKTGWGSSRANYLAELVVERLTGIPQDTYISVAMQHGIDCEPEARIAYEWASNAAVTEIGFILHPRIAMSGASPDGLIGDDGLTELKCPQSAAHLDTLLSQSIPPKYVPQMMWQMAVTGRQWCDYVSYDPRMPDHMRLFIKRLPRDNVVIEELEELVQDFLGELDEKIARLRALYEPLLMAG